MNLLKSVTLLSISAVLLLAAPGSEQSPQIKKVINQGQHSTKLLLKTLGSNMKKNMKAGGAAKALDFCSQEAYNLTEDVNKKLPNGVRVKRISSKYRNPVNKPQNDEMAVLESLQTLKDANVVLPKQLVQKVDAHTYKYYKPLIINKQICLKCHGDVKDTDLKRTIAERYPVDKAMHYKMGDLRGAVVVTIKK
jgi:hypothetical protein